MTDQEPIMPSSTQVTANIDRSLGTFLSELETADPVDARLRIEDGDPVLGLDALKIRLHTFIDIEDGSRPLGSRNADTSVEVACDGDNGCWWQVYKDEEQGKIEYPNVTIQPELVKDD